MFFSHDKSAISTFSHGFSAKRMGLLFMSFSLEEVSRGLIKTLWKQI
jgi:hypothetical protein